MSADPWQSSSSCATPTAASRQLSFAWSEQGLFFCCAAGAVSGPVCTAVSSTGASSMPRSCLHTAGPAGYTTTATWCIMQPVGSSSTVSDSGPSTGNPVNASADRHGCLGTVLTAAAEATDAAAEVPAEGTRGSCTAARLLQSIRALRSALAGM